VHIEWVELSGYRNHAQLSYSPGRALNILQGRNARGKTNLLEALGLLLAGRSFRGARPADLPSWGVETAQVAGEIVRDEGGGVARALRWTVSRREETGGTVTGERCPWARVIAFGWPDLGLLHGAPAARRAFLDRFAAKLSLAHGALAARVRQVIGRRNALLQRGESPGALEPWDEQLARLGAELVRRRRDAVDRLAGVAPALFERLGGRGSLGLRYESALAAGADAAAFRMLLAARGGEERRRGQTLVGPHRDDLAVEVDGRDMRTLGSRGQQRLLALALRLAEARPVAAAVGSPPVLLLDDALSELDGETQRAVLRELGGMGQAFLTTADAGLPAVEASWWAVEPGRVSAAAPEPAWTGA
jgi:DNA replication and repair protein RecF